ncbi:MAG: PspC domain-containing protein [Saprospiraceae bacterium]|nr:PspC domain-containing protein [Saprospiraceae bacterium]
MNKIVTINLGGYPFTIDEDAYAHLQGYLEAIRKHFSQVSGFEEITSDIESRLAEIFQEKLGDRPIVTLKDVEGAIAVMGRPEDFDADAEMEEEESSKATNSKSKYKTGKRLFRHPDDQVVSGVCAGIAAYFGIQDPVWVRILFVLFTISGGFGITVYIILWAILPEAKTAGDRLTMRGEAINVSNIGKIIQEEVENISKKVSEFGDEITSKEGSKVYGVKFDGESGKKVVDGIGYFFKKAIDTILAIAKPILFLMAIGILIALLVTWIISVVGIFFGMPFAERVLPGQGLLSSLAVFNLMFLIGIPMLSIALGAFRLVFGTRMSKRWGIGLSAFWGLNMVSFFALASMVGREFSTDVGVSQNMNPGLMQGDTVHLVLSPTHYDNDGTFYDQLEEVEQEIFGAEVSLAIKKSDKGIFELQQKVFARGRDQGDANLLASQLNVPLKIEGNKITFPNRFPVPKDQKWRNQRVKLTLLVPEKSFVQIDRKMGRILSSVDLENGRVNPWREPNNAWEMRAEGLSCISCEKVEEEAVDQRLSVKDFKKLRLEGEMKVMIDRADRYTIRLSGPAKYTDLLKINQAGDHLTIQSPVERPDAPIRLFITLPELEAIEALNTDDVRINGFQQSFMQLYTQGKFEVKTYLELDSLLVQQNQGNKLDINGRYGYLDAQLQTSARLDAGKASLNTARINLQGDSHAKLAYVESLQRRKDDSSSIRLEGSGQVKDF